MLFRSYWPPRLALAWAGVLLLAGLGVAEAQPPKKQRITFAATAWPLDPFSEQNAAKRPAEKPLEVRRGETFLVAIRGTPAPGFHTYPLTKKAPEQPEGQLAQIQVEPSEGLVPLAPFQETEPELVEPVGGLPAEYEHTKPFDWTQEVYVKPTASVGATLALTYKLHIQVCDTSCYIEDHTVKVAVKVVEGEVQATTPDLEKRIQTAGKTDQPSSEKGAGTGSDNTSRPTGFLGLLGAIGFAIVGGYVSLLTPCVFPMIPITVSYFLKQSEGKQGNALAMAAVYSGTITLVLAVGGMALLGVLYQISTHPVTNFAIGVVFLVFGLSLLGMYDITLPSFLQEMTSSREGQGGLVGVFFMGLTFSIISFACVGPIYGGFIAYSATDSSALGLAQRLLPVVAYSAAFASPFFLLALFPSALRTLPRAGSWMNTVKVVMGFLELAAVVKFLRAAELTGTGKAVFLSYDLSLGMYVALSLACGLYLLGLFRLPHDHDAPESIGVMRLLFSLGFLSLGLYLLPGLFKTDKGEGQQPNGEVYAWIDAFLLPDQRVKGGWHTKVDAALAQAKKENKLVFVDFTGINCTNCAYNERNAFRDPAVQAAFSKRVLLKLYTDTVPAGVDQQPDARGSIQLRNERFKTEALPVYAILRPTDDSFEILRIHGQDGNGLIKTTDVPAFVKFVAD